MDGKRFRRLGDRLVLASAEGFLLGCSVSANWFELPRVLQFGRQ